MARLARPFAHGLSGVVAASMSRQRRLLSRGLMIMALTGSFAVSTAVFNANKLERRFRDMHTIAQQIQGRDSHYEDVGKAILSANLATPPTAR